MRLIPFKRKDESKTDEQLVSAYYKNRDSAILGELYGRHMHLVYGVCLKYFKEPEQSKDAVMAIYEKIREELPRHQVKHFKNWLYVITKNFCLMELRKHKAGRMVYLSGEDLPLEFMEIGHALHPVDSDNCGKDLEALQECLEKLKPEQRQCVSLFYYENKCYRDIAVILNLDEKKVKSHIQNGKRNLKICIENNHGQK
ncbi:MAG: RNA polymerase sigma factor [Bacteroidota bacterium]